jgi:hypothetical protein
MRGQEGFEVARGDVPLATEINRPELLQLDPVKNARLRHLNQVRNLFHGQEPSRQHCATPVCRPSMPAQCQGTQSAAIDVHQCLLRLIERI